MPAFTLIKCACAVGTTEGKIWVKSRRIWFIKQVWNDTCRSQDQNKRLWFVVWQVLEQYFSSGFVRVQGVQRSSKDKSVDILEAMSGSVSP